MAGARHLKVRIEPELHQALVGIARRQGVSVSAAVRELIRSHTDRSAKPLPGLEPVIYANLLATELAVQLITSILPAGSEEVPRYIEAAAEEATRRVERIELALSEGEQPWRP